jgi:hypothetical protein
MPNALCFAVFQLIQRTLNRLARSSFDVPKTFLRTFHGTLQGSAARRHASDG